MEMLLQSSQGNQHDLIVRHGKKEISFFVSPYLKLSREMTEEELFIEINQFYAQLEPEAQQNIFNIYLQIHSEFTDESVANPMYGDRKTTREKLSVLVQQLYQEIRYEDMEYWVKFKSNITLPTSLKEEFGPDDTGERTYLITDYIELVVLTIAVRAAIPIFALYINAFSSDSGSAFKEYDAFRLLMKSWLPESRPMQRLLLFLENNIVKEDEADSAILNGLSRPELPRWLLSLAVVVRLPVARVNSTGTPGSESSIVSNIYFYIVKNILKSLDRKFKGRVQDKVKPRETASGDQDKSSIVDQYKMKQEVSEGVIAVIKAYLENTDITSQRIAPGISKELVDESVQLMLSRTGTSFGSFHKVITCWIFADDVPPRGIQSLHLERTLLHAFGTALAILIHWEQYELAAMLLSRNENIVDEVLIADARQRLSKEITDELVVLAPYYQKGTGSKASIEPDKLQRSNNPVVLDINAITKDCMAVLWFIEPDIQRFIAKYAPANHPVYNMVGNRRRLSVPSNVKDLLGTLAIRCMAKH